MSTKWRILAIDDDPGTLELITMALEDAYDLITLTNPIVALDIAKLFEPDLFLLDLMMPKVDGFHLLDIFHREGSMKSVAVMILSAKKTKRDIQYGYHVGATLYLTKPFQPSRLRRNVDFFFEHNPPPKRIKHITFVEVCTQIQFMRCYKEGSVAFPGIPIKETSAKQEESVEGSKGAGESKISGEPHEAKPSRESSDTPHPGIEPEERKWID